MKLGKRPGIVRRPVEYILLVIAVVLIGVLLWSLSVIKREEARVFSSHTNSSRVQEPEGSLSTILTSLEQEFVDENAEYLLEPGGSYDTFQAAADNLSTVYDEAEIVSSGRDFCVELDDQTNRISRRFSTLRQKLTKAAADARGEVANRLQIVSQQTGKLRQAGDVFRSQSFELLRQRLSEDRKKGVSEYREKMSAIVSQRQQANDNRYKAYWHAVEQELVADNIRLSLVAAENFETAFRATVETARDRCTQGGIDDQAQVFRSSLESARLSYAGSRRNSYEQAERTLSEASKIYQQAGVSIKQSFERELQKLRSDSEAQTTSW